MRRCPEWPATGRDRPDLGRSPDTEGLELPRPRSWVLILPDNSTGDRRV